MILLETDLKILASSAAQQRGSQVFCVDNDGILNTLGTLESGRSTLRRYENG